MCRRHSTGLGLGAVQGGKEVANVSVWAMECLSLNWQRGVGAAAAAMHVDVEQFSSAFPFRPLFLALKQ